jgi:hypothetical protein
MENQMENQNMARSAQKTSDYQPLFDNLSHIIGVSRTKFDLKRASNSDKMKWARLLILGCQAYASLMESAKIEDLEQRIIKIEQNTHLSEKIASRGGFYE